MGKLIVIDGTDGCGKQTQSIKLKEKLEETGHRVRLLSFPRYDLSTSLMVKKYLSGEVKADPYEASVYFAWDRFGSYEKDWKEDAADPNCILVADRYVSSNAIFQGAKLEGKERRQYLRWLDHFEYEALGLPRPDAVCWLDLPVEESLKLMADRPIKSGQKKDIHESDTDLLRRAHDTAKWLAGEYDWRRIDCGMPIRTPDEIFADLWKEAVAVVS